MRVRRKSDRGVYDDRTAAILSAGLIAHVGVTTDSGPLVLPMAYGVDAQELYLHGAIGNALLKTAVDHEICATITVLDGLVIARSAFHNSMNYRSVVVRGRARQLVGDEKSYALRLISDHIVETWRFGRAPTESEIRSTIVLAVPLVEVSGKIRTGDPIDEPSDLALDNWAGVIPIETMFGEPQAAGNLRPGVAPATNYGR